MTATITGEKKNRLLGAGEIAVSFEFFPPKTEKMEENLKSFQNLEENLRALNLNLDDIPYVLQYNKRDLPNVAPVECLDYVLNNREQQVPSFTASANNCEGVFETLNMIVRLLLHKFINEGKRKAA